MSERWSSVIFALLLATALLLVGFLSTRYPLEHDFSHAQRASLSATSTRLLDSMPGPIEVVSYARRQGDLRQLISEFFKRYQRSKPDMQLRFVDPDADPTAMREAGVQIDGELEVRYQGRSERLQSLSERDLAQALVRLAHASTPLIAFLEGEGERRPDAQGNADLGQFAALLQERGANLVNLALASTPRIPANVDLLVIANPRVALTSAQVESLLDYVRTGGHLLWFLEANEAVGLQPLADALSMHVLPGVIVDGNAQSFGIEDPSFVAANHYPAHAITRGFDLVTVFPQPVALAHVSDGNWTAQPILVSSGQSWNETGPIPKAGEAAGSVRFDGDNGEVAGPLDFAFALTRPSPRTDAGEQRVVVIGDGDFLSNSFLGNGGNSELGRRVFDWLLVNDALIDIPPRAAPDRQLELSQSALSAIAFVFLIGLPLGLAGSGWLIRRVRRRG